MRTTTWTTPPKGASDRVAGCVEAMLVQDTMNFRIPIRTHKLATAFAIMALVPACGSFVWMTAPGTYVFECGADTYSVTPRRNGAQISHNGERVAGRYEIEDNGETQFGRGPVRVSFPYAGSIVTLYAERTVTHVDSTGAPLPQDVTVTTSSEAGDTVQSCSVSAFHY